jgi:hypothetical protein
MVAVTPVRSGKPCGRLSYWRNGRKIWWGEAPERPKNIEAHRAFLKYLICYLVAPAEPWPSACHIAEGGKALGNAVGFALPVILRLITRSAAARRAQRGNA